MRLAIVILVSAGLAASAAAQSDPTPWGYTGKTGPLAWGRLNPEYAACSKGDAQSPLDIRGARLNKGLEPIEFHYVAGPVTLVNDGHGIQVQVDPVSYIVAAGVRYNLTGYKFHHPSEHTVRGKLSDMEIDLMHRSADGRTANVAVLLSESMGNPNATLATLWEHLPASAGKTEKVTEMVNAGGLLPADRGYWTYTGSELTPPCSEGVKWFVFEQQVSMSRSQYNDFVRLYKMNTRPLQNAHGRKIEANE